jgi:hypothetical protein
VDDSDVQPDCEFMPRLIVNPTGVSISVDGSIALVAGHGNLARHILTSTTTLTTLAGRTGSTLVTDRTITSSI